MQNANDPADFRSQLHSQSANETARRSGKVTSTRADFTGPQTNLQVRVPQDLVQSLRLLAIQNNTTMSELVFEALTSEATITKAWISTRRAG